MAISLYDVTVAGYLQHLAAVADVLERGRKHCEETGTDIGELFNARLADDMFPLTFQVGSVRHHSLGALQGCQAGQFAPPPALPADIDYAGLQALIADTIEKVSAFSRADVEALEGKDVIFKLGPMEMPFTAENFLLSFSIPNFHFHATTTYDLLRMKGVKLGKRNYMGKMRMKG